MASVRVSWTPTPTSFPEGTPALTHYVAHLGALVSPDLAPGLSTHTFADVAPGDYPSAVDSMAGAVVLATHAGNVVHVPSPVLIPVAMGVNAAVGAVVDSIEKIQADYLRGAELQLNAFNRAMALCQSPMVPIAMQVRAELVEDQGDIT